MRNKFTVLLVSAATLTATITALAQHSVREQEHEAKQKYTCLMHPEVITDRPGNCPKCGMKLVPVKQEKHRTPNVQRSTSNHQSHMSHESHETHGMQMEMHSSIDLADPMSREGSGTSWLPDSSPMYVR